MTVIQVIYVGFLGALITYMYAIIGVTKFGENDPFYFGGPTRSCCYYASAAPPIWQVALSDQMCVWASGNLAVALLTLFRVISMDSWSYIMYYQMWGCGQPNWDKKGHDRGFGDCE